MKFKYIDNWKLLFKIGDIKRKEFDKPLTVNILSDPSHEITKRLLYLYTMEDFIYYDLNRASREKNVNEIAYYGSYAAALSYIIQHANSRRKDKEKIKGNAEFYRGLKMPGF